MELRPQFAQMVFQRRSRQAEFVACPERGCDLRGLGADILDVLRFIENQQMEIMLHEYVFITRQQGVSRQYDVGLTDTVEISGAVLQAVIRVWTEQLPTIWECLQPL